MWSNGQVRAWNDDEPRAAPYDFGVPFNLPNHPVVGITWYEANAYCKWLATRKDLPEVKEISALSNAQLVFRLPTEAEWEAAAGGVGLPSPTGRGAALSLSKGAGVRGRTALPGTSPAKSLRVKKCRCLQIPMKAASTAPRRSGCIHWARAILMN